jgi:hypothetical protein
LVELRWVDGGYEATVRWPNGETTGIKQQPAVDTSKVDETLARVGRSKSKWIARDLEGGSFDPVRDLGERLFLSLIDGGLGSHYHQAVGRATAAARHLRLCLTMADRRLADLPWELLYDLKRQDFVALSVRTPLVRRWVVEGHGLPAAEAAPLEGPLRLLVVNASAKSSGAPLEIGALRQAEGEGLRISRVVEGATKARLLEAVAQGDEPLFHFVGSPQEGRRHEGEPQLVCSGDGASPSSRAPGDPSARTPGEPSVLAPGELLDALRDRKRAGLPPLRFAFWSSGHTDAFARDVAPGLAASAGVRDALTGQGAGAFAAGLYRALAAGRSVATAFTEARQRVDREQPGNREWVLPVLYLQHAASLGPRAPGPSRGLGTELEAESRPLRLAHLRLEMHRRNVEVLRQAVADAEAGNPPPHLAEQLDEAERLFAEAQQKLAEVPP